MKKCQTDKRSEPRKCFDVSDTGHTLETVLEGKHYQFKLLNLCRGGAGILIQKNQEDALKTLKKGHSMKMNYINPAGSLEVNLEIRHVTLFTEGPYQGNYAVGFSMSVI